MKISINRSPFGWASSMQFALCQLADGVVRTLSLGFLYTNLPTQQAKNTAKKRFERQQKEPK